MCSYKRIGLALALIFVISVHLGWCQEDDEDDEEYEEDVEVETTTRKYRRRTTSTTTTTTTTQLPPAMGRNETAGTVSNTTQTAAVPSAAVIATNTSGTTGGESSGTAAVPAVAGSGAVAAAAPSPSTQAPTTRPPTAATRATTPEDSEEEIETTTEEEGYGYIFRPLNNLIDNIVAGNVSGIVDNALSIRTPPEIRGFVNHVMHNVFGASIGTALKQFMPSLFTTVAPPTTGTGRDPIPNPAAPAPPQIAIPIQAIIDARSNATEDAKIAKTQQLPLQLKVSHPGAPASRLRCEVIAE